ncbi:MAG: hypothetical protein ACI93R_003956 [Flavobacteriales bacterium]|jgi:hypothetical protein
MKSIAPIKTLLSTAVLALALSACSGGDNKKDPVDEGNSAPTITSTAPTSATVDDAFTYSLVGNDSDGDALTLSAPTLPAWLAFDAATGVLSGTPAESDIGDHSVILTVTDGEDSLNESFTISVAGVAAVNTAPTVTSTAVLDATVDGLYSYTLVATDADGDDLTLSVDIPSALTWLTFDETSGVLSGTPFSGDLGATEITLVASDGVDDVTQTFTITVGDAVFPLIVNAYENDPGSYIFADFDGGVAQVIANPQIEGINTSAQVVQMQKFAGATWGASNHTFENEFPLEAGMNTFTMKVWSERVVAVLFKFEGNIAEEREVNHGGTGWEELTFEFNDLAADLAPLTAASIFFDNGTMGAADTDPDNWTFYFDDISKSSAPPVVVDPPVIVDLPVVALTVFADSFADSWNAWSDGAATATVVTDADAAYGEVVEFTTSGEVVAGLTTRADIGGGGTPYDASAIAATGTLEFDLKMTAAPATTIWKIKIEGVDAIEIDLPSTPVLDTWVHYSIALNLFGDQSAVNNIMLFPNWADNAGAVYRVDNVEFSGPAQ